MIVTNASDGLSNIVKLLEQHHSSIKCYCNQNRNKKLSFLSKTSTAKVDSLMKVLKDSMNICSKQWTIIISTCFKKCLFCDELK